MCRWSRRTPMLSLHCAVMGEWLPGRSLGEVFLFPVLAFRDTVLRMFFKGFNQTGNLGHMGQSPAWRRQRGCSGAAAEREGDPSSPLLLCCNWDLARYLFGRGSSRFFRSFRRILRRFCGVLAVLAVEVLDKQVP